MPGPPNRRAKERMSSSDCGTSLLTTSRLTDRSATVVFGWEKVRLPIKIEMDTPNAALAKATEEAAAGGRPAWNWANYFFQNAVHTETALGWAHLADHRYRSIQLASNRGFVSQPVELCKTRDLSLRPWPRVASRTTLHKRLPDKRWT